MNATDTQDIKGLLLRSDDGYSQLVEQHHQLDDRLHQLVERHHISVTEELEEHAIKKQKLALKDRMEAMAHSYTITRQPGH